MNPELFIKFHAGNALSSPSLGLIDPLIIQANELQPLLETTTISSPETEPEAPETEPEAPETEPEAPETEPEAPETEPEVPETEPPAEEELLTPMQQASLFKRKQAEAALIMLSESLTALNDYIVYSLDTVIDDLCLHRSALELDPILGSTTGSVSNIVQGQLTGTLNAAAEQLNALAAAITEYKNDDIHRIEFEFFLDTCTFAINDCSYSINSSIAAETAEKARIVKLHKSMSSTLRAQILMENPETTGIMAALGLSAGGA